MDCQVDPGPPWVSQGMPSEDGEDEDGYFRSVGAYSIFISSTFYGFNIIRQDVFLLHSRVTTYEIRAPIGVVRALNCRKEI